MVSGIDIFRKHFSDFKKQYTIIGGFACDLLMTDAGLDFRQTVDIDMVLTVEALTTEFANAFWTLFADPASPQGQPLSRLELHPQREVWLEPISCDTHLREELRGWYRIKSRWAENEYGNRFYLDTYGAKWLAFDKKA